MFSLVRGGWLGDFFHGKNVFFAHVGVVLPKPTVVIEKCKIKKDHIAKSVHLSHETQDVLRERKREKERERNPKDVFFG